MLILLVSSPLAHLLGHAGIGAFDLLIGWACVAELIAGVSIVEVAPDCGHLQGNLKVAIFLCSNLGQVVGGTGYRGEKSKHEFPLNGSNNGYWGLGERR